MATDDSPRVVARGRGWRRKNVIALGIDARALREGGITRRALARGLTRDVDGGAGGIG